MRLNKFLAVLLGLGLAAQAQALTVTTSFSIIEDMVKNVAGNKVDVLTIAGPDADVHSFEFKPSDVAKLSPQSGAKIFFVNGLGLDGWTEQLAKGAGFKGEIVSVSRKVKPRAMPEGDAHDHADHNYAGIDPHAWQSLSNAQLYVDEIAAALVKVDLENAPTYIENAKRYKAQLQDLDKTLRAEFKQLPHKSRYLITTHEALGYFADTYDLHLVSPLGFSTSAEPSAKEVAAVIEQIRKNKIPAVFFENVKNPALLEQIAKESGAVIGGTLYTDALSATGPASSYLGMYQYNAETILTPLKP